MSSAELAATRFSPVLLGTALEICLVPAIALQAEAGRRHQLHQLGLLAIGAVGQRGIIHFLHGVELVSARPAAILVKRHVINPNDFIPVAEDCGLIAPIGEWTIATACKQIRAWREAGLNEQRISVNVSPRQFRDQDLVSIFRTHLAENDVPASAFTIEITESTLIVNIGDVEHVIRDLHEMGVRFALDDFGTGFASLAYLKDFPIEVVKIDRSFIAGVPDSVADSEIVSAISGLTRGLKLRLLAEGVENERQLDFVKGLGCQMGQGFYWSKALPPDQYEQFYLNRFYNIG